jgi:nucleotide-binding universal stress UspA family protein
MAQSSHQRIVVGLPFPVLALQNFLHLFADADTRCIFLHVLSPKRDDPVDAEDLQNKLAASLQQRPESIAIRRGDFLDELLAFAAEAQADLLLVSPPATGKPRVLARRLAMKAPCSVWMAPEGSPISSSNILVPVDFSSRSEDALRRAAEIASLQGRGWITALHVYFDEAVVTYEGHQEVVRLKEESQFETFLSRIDLGDVRVRTRWVESSHVAETILRTATEIGAGWVRAVEAVPPGS